MENIDAIMAYKCQICYTTRTCDMASVLLIVMFYFLQGGQSSGSVQPCEVSGDGKDPHNSVVFSLKNQVGGLARALQVFQVMFRCFFFFFANLRRAISLLGEVSMLCLRFRASLIYINNCPTRCKTKQFIYYYTSSLYIFRVSTTPMMMGVVDTRNI